MELEAPCCVFQYLIEGIRWNGNRSRKPHVRRRRIDIAFGHVGYYRGDKCIAQGNRNSLRELFDTYVVLSQSHLWPTLFGASDRHDDRRTS